jgi:hypothetical protein
MSPIIRIDSICTTELNISEIERDALIQCRAALSNELVRTYAAALNQGSESLGRMAIKAEMFNGNRADAVWDAIGCNATHGLRRSRTDNLIAIRRAMDHPQSVELSHRELARHVGIPESSFRRLLGQLHLEAQPERIVSRRGRTYRMHVQAIGKCAQDKVGQSRLRSRNELRAGLSAMKKRASQPVRDLLNIFGNWALGTATDDDCLAAFERLRYRWQGAPDESRPPSRAVAE